MGKANRLNWYHKQTGIIQHLKQKMKNLSLSGWIHSFDLNFDNDKLVLLTLELNEKQFFISDLRTIRLLFYWFGCLNSGIAAHTIRCVKNVESKSCKWQSKKKEEDRFNTQFARSKTNKIWFVIVQVQVLPMNDMRVFSLLIPLLYFVYTVNNNVPPS